MGFTTSMKSIKCSQVLKFGTLDVKIEVAHLVAHDHFISAKTDI